MEIPGSPSSAAIDSTGARQAGAGAESGSSVQWQAQMDQLDAVIRSACDVQPPALAIKRISEIWERLDRCSELAAARSRILLNKIEPPELGVVPKWFAEQRARLSQTEKGEFTPNTVALECAELLVRAAVAKVGEQDSLEADVETGPLGRIVLDWKVPKGRLQWMVEAIDLPWPSVKVYQLAVRAGTERSGPPDTRILHTAFDVLEEFAGVVST